MKKIVKGLIITAAVLGTLEAALQVYVRIEENKRGKAPGNDARYDVENLAKHDVPELKDKTIIFLGSSVTYGAAAEGLSFVELFEHLDGVNVVKEAKSGTTLADKNSILALLAFGNGDSYVKRLKNLDQGMKANLLVCQLSTNDTSLKMPLGEISEGRELSSFDAKTVTGAMETIIRYAEETWHCPVVFYTGSYYESPEYEAMVKRLYELKEKWNIGIIDLYTDQEFNKVSKQEYDFWMYDPIHPVKAGYIEWWMPRMESELARMMKELQ